MNNIILQSIIEYNVHKKNIEKMGLHEIIYNYL